MKHIVRVCAASLVALVLVVSGSLEVFAAPSGTYRVANSAQHNSAVEERVRLLEERFDIVISYPVFERYGVEIAAIYPQSLDTLEAALNAVTPSLVRQVSAYFQEEHGLILTFAYVYADLRGPYGSTGSNDVTVGTFHGDSARIELYIPYQDQGAVATGDNVLTVTHEFGHAVHQVIMERYGARRLTDEWTELLDGNAYGRGQMDPRIFITEYASTSLDEDFAETFAHVFACNRPGLGFSNLLIQEGRQDMSVLGRKVAYIESLLPRTFENINGAMYNYRKVYTTATSTNYKGIKLSGFHLVSINMAEPRSIPLMLVTLLRVNESEAVWIPEIGAWYTTDLFGNHLCLFPDGTWGNAGRNMLAA